MLNSWFECCLSLPICSCLPLLFKRVNRQRRSLTVSIYVTFMSIEHSVWYLLLKNFARGYYSKAKPSICFVECNINLDSTNSQVLVFTRSLPIISSIQNQWEHRERTPQRNRCYFTKDSRVSFWTATCVLPFNITSHPSLLFPSLSQTFSSSHLEWIAALEGMLPETKQRRLKRMPPWRRRGIFMITFLWLAVMSYAN